MRMPPARPTGLSVLLSTILALAWPAGIARADIFSDFESSVDSVEGWLVVDLADTFGSGPYTTIVKGPFVPDYSPDEGHPGGCVKYLDTPGNSFFFQAPTKFLGDRSASYGLMLSYDLKSEQTTVGDWYVEADVILTGNNGKILAAQLVKSAPRVWKTYTIPLNEGAWHRSSLTGSHPTQAEFLAVLSDLKSLWIRGEHFYGFDRAYFDNVRIEEPPPPKLSITLSGDKVQLTALVPANSSRVYAVEWSSDLLTWDELGSFIPPAESFTQTRDLSPDVHSYFRIRAR